MYCVILQKKTCLYGFLEHVANAHDHWFQWKVHPHPPWIVIGVNGVQNAIYFHFDTGGGLINAKIIDNNNYYNYNDNLY